MSFNETILAIEAEEAKIDNFFDRCTALLEASYNEYNINLKEAELKVIEERGTKEDKDYLKGKASEGLIGKASKIIKGIIEAFKKWLKETCEKITKFFGDKKTEIALKKAQKVCKSNKEIGNTKVEVEDQNAVKRVFGQLEDKVNKKIALIKAGRATEKDDKELDDIANEVSGLKKKKVIATVGISISALVACLIGYKTVVSKNSNSKINDVKEGDVKTPEDAARLTKAFNLIANITKEKVARSFAFLTKGVSTVKTKITGKGVVDTTLESSEDSIVNDLKDEVKNEVAENSINDEEKFLESLIEDLDLDEELEESSIIDYDYDNIFEEGSFESYANEILGIFENSEIEESEDDDDLADYIATMESELFEEEDYDDIDYDALMESLDDDEFDELLESVEEDEDDTESLMESFEEDIEAELIINDILSDLD